MRKSKPPVLRGDRRIRRGFLFFPKTINGSMRWWEHGEWEVEAGMFSWVEIRWTDQPEIPDRYARPSNPPPGPPDAIDMMREKMARREAEDNVAQAISKAGLSKPPAEASAYQGVPMGIKFDEQPKRDRPPEAPKGISEIQAEPAVAVGDIATGANALQPNPPDISPINIDPSRIGELEKYFLPSNHAFRSIHRTLTPAEAALSRAIKDQAYVLLQLVEMTPSGRENQLSRHALEDCVMRAGRAITQ